MIPMRTTTMTISIAVKPNGSCRISPSPCDLPYHTTCRDITIVFYDVTKTRMVRHSAVAAPVQVVALIDTVSIIL